VLKECARAACGSFLRNQCMLEYVRIQADTPSVIPTANDDTGTPVVNVRVRMDGEALTSKIDGHAVPINPGLHEFSFERDGVVATKKIVISQGEQNRPVSTSLQRKTRAPAPEAIAVAPEPAVVVRAPPRVAIPAPPPKAPSRRGAN